MNSCILAACPILAATAALAEPALKAPLEDAKGETIGNVTVTDAPDGVLLRVEVQGLTPGWHDMHLPDKGLARPPNSRAPAVTSIWAAA